MACPIVAGIIAQWLEAIPYLTREQVIDAFQATCRRHDPSLVYPNNDYGYGEIDAEAGLLFLLEHPDGIEEIDNRWQTTSGRQQTTEYYNLTGQRLARPQKGINIINRRKVLK